MAVIDNLKIQDGGWQPCWILAFAVCSRNYRKSNFEEKEYDLVIFAGHKNVIGNLKIHDDGRPLYWISVGGARGWV